MARLPRFRIAGQPHHVIQRGNNRTPIFRCPADYRVFRTCLADAIDRFACQVHAYVFMTNHVHLLVTAGATDGIGRAMQSVGRRYVRYFNDRHGRTGTLWEGRYRATVIDTNRYLFACSRYIEENPVRAGMVAAPWQYTWSSFGANALGLNDSLVTAHSEFLSLGPTPRARHAAYRALFSSELDMAECHAIRDATAHGWALGDPAFLAAVNATGRRPTARARGEGGGRPAGSKKHGVRLQPNRGV